MLTYCIYILIINVGCMLLGYFLTQNDRLSLPSMSKYLDRKPFNCRPCFTFHLLWIVYTFVAILEHSWFFFTIGIIFSFAIFGVLYLEDKNKISK